MAEVDRLPVELQGWHSASDLAQLWLRGAKNGKPPSWLPTELAAFVRELRDAGVVVWSGGSGGPFASRGDYYRIVSLEVWVSAKENMRAVQAAAQLAAMDWLE